MQFDDMTTVALVDHATQQVDLTPLELALLDRLQGALEEIDSLVEALSAESADEEVRKAEEYDGDRQR